VRLLGTDRRYLIAPDSRSPAIARYAVTSAIRGMNIAPTAVRFQSAFRMDGSDWVFCPKYTSNTINRVYSAPTNQTILARRTSRKSFFATSTVLMPSPPSPRRPHPRRSCTC
jgi:hypothetical protein